MMTQEQMRIYQMNLDIEATVQRLVEARRAYYGTGYAIMTDQEYDSLEDLVRQHDPNHPFFETIGHHPISLAWIKTNHNIFMGSLDKVNTREEFEKWVSKFEKNTLFSMQFKLDGLSLSLDYNSKFLKAITRGDGIEGENISPNATLMRGFKKKLPGFSGSIRAEVLLNKKDFQKINKALVEKDQYSNPRNAAAGISQRLDGKFCKYLQLIAYDINEPLDEPDKIEKLKEFGFNTPIQIIGEQELIITSFESVKQSRETLSYDIDGVVIKACSYELQQSMGTVRNKPKAQKAWKFDPPGAVTVFIEETWEVGRTGVVTPLAHLEPVNIEGAIIKKATLHNVAEIKRLNIGRGDTVMLVRRGDIIPKIVSILEHKGTPIKIPTHCPGCETKLDNDGTRLFCLNDSCPKKNFFRILNWIKVTGIDNFGESLAEELCLLGKLSSIADIYRLTRKDISSIERWGSKSANKVVENINKTKSLSPIKFLCALGIPSISESTSAELMGAFKTIEFLTQKDTEDIKKLNGFSDISANKIVEGLLKHKSEIEYLLTIISLKAGDAQSGLSFCFTGAMNQPRSYYQKLVTEQGFINKSSVVKGLTYLVCNEDRRSNKSVRAEKYGVKVISEKEFLEMIGNPEPPENSPIIENFSLFDSKE